MIELKQHLLNLCNHLVEDKLKAAQKRIQSLQNDLLSETKSSAGDKHETSRAMLHLEIEKAAQQLESINQMKETLERINMCNKSKFAYLGSLIETKNETYFLSVSLGQLTLKDKKYFTVSASSPIGKEFVGKKVGDMFLFNGRKIEINSVS